MAFKRSRLYRDLKEHSPRPRPWRYARQESSTLAWLGTSLARYVCLYSPHGKCASWSLPLAVFQFQRHLNKKLSAESKVHLQVMNSSGRPTRESQPYIRCLDLFAKSLLCLFLALINFSKSEVSPPRTPPVGTYWETDASNVAVEFVVFSGFCPPVACDSVGSWSWPLRGLAIILWIAAGVSNLSSLR